MIILLWAACRKTGEYIRTVGLDGNTYFPVAFVANLASHFHSWGGPVSVFPPQSDTFTAALFRCL
jgi:hypothetical protein